MSDEMFGYEQAIKNLEEELEGLLEVKERDWLIYEDCGGDKRVETLRLAISAMEKQIPMKARTFKTKGGDIESDCPVCKGYILGIADYCDECGQKLYYEIKGDNGEIVFQNLTKEQEDNVL